MIAFGNGERIREDARGLAVGSAVIVVLLSSFPDIASNFAADSLRAMGLGSETVDLALRPEQTEAVEDGEHALVLDTGTQLYLLACDASTERRGIEVVA